MKKKGIILFCFLLLSLSVAPFLSAAENDTEESKVDFAYKCLEAKVLNKCDTLSYEEKIFSLLALRQCKSELLAEAVNDECFPNSGCTIKTTAQAILALDKMGESTSEYENWLLSQNKTPTDISWYLQIDSSEETICEISYGSNEYTVSIGENKKISSGAGCLSLAQDNYWLEISQSCFSNEFEISCDKPFVTSLLFKKKDSSKIYVSGETNFASAEGRTTEKINSYCFTQGGSCNYEGSLWAVLVLDYLGYEISSYTPYLLTMAEVNARFLPESFLYILTDDSDYRIQLLEKQKLDYWDESGDKIYDTALALYPFQYEEINEKIESKEWLLDIQDNQGCWKGSVRNTGFVLYSVWPKDFGGGGTIVEEDCELDAGGFCMSSISCDDAGGNELYSYSSSCSGLNICCDKEKTLETCDELNGEECASGQECSTNTITSLDTDECCLGYCREPIVQPDCEIYGGDCRTSCNEDEEESSDSCNSGYVCCIEKSVPDKKSYWWIWVLLGLIVLVLLGIIFRDKLRPFWFRLTSKFGKPKSPPPRRGYPMPFGMSPRRLVPRKTIPSSGVSQRGPFAQKPKEPSRHSSELDEVLKKLKEIGK